jgi:hypothetical protein
MRLIVVLAITLCIVAGAAPARAVVCGEPSDVLLLLDRSGSMKEYAGLERKWEIAVAAVNSLVQTFSGQLNFGLMLFSHHPFIAHCSKGAVNVDPGSSTGNTISSLLSGITPQGDTPLSLSLDEARTYLELNPTGNAQYVVLITDGKETCQETWENTPDLAAGKLLASGIKTYVVGFGAEVDPVSLSDTAMAGGTGSYYQADDLSQLNQALKQIAGAISCCGNGKLDPGEQCDIGIPLGVPGSCPVSCNDGNPCTSDIKLDQGCSSTCYHASFTTPLSGDGCCPPGANSTTDSDCPAGCGDGKLDPGESCDTGIPAGQYGGCPVTCEDGNTCTLDLVAGSGCHAYCTHANTCPADLCGDGKVNLGESCDTAIPAGAPGACPLTCDDNNPCTSDTLIGSGCVTQCMHLPITLSMSGDGCCPPGANSLTDGDCPASCGNGVVDPGEGCDPAITGGPGACIQSCDDGNPCTTDFLSGSACNVTCGHTIVAPNPAAKDGCCPTGLNGKQDADCPAPCDPDSHENCVDPCVYVQCPTGSVCSKGQCVAKQDDGGGPEIPALAAPSGCDCRVAQTSSPTPASLFLLGLTLLGLARRAPRARRLAAARAMPATQPLQDASLCGSPRHEILGTCTHNPSADLRSSGMKSTRGRTRVTCFARGGSLITSPSPRSRPACTTSSPNVKRWTRGGAGRGASSAFAGTGAAFCTARGAALAGDAHNRTAPAAT